MGLFSIIDNLVKETKNDKFEKIILYTKNNLDKIYQRIVSLENEAKALVDKINASKGKKLSKAESKLIKNDELEVIDMISSLYLARDYFSILIQVINGNKQKDYYYNLTLNFMPFFEGFNIFDCDEEDIDDIILDTYGVKRKDFDFYSYLDKYSDDVEEFEFPNVISSLNEFASLVKKNVKNDNKNNGEICKTSECPNCHNLLNPDAKFCPNCGNIIVKETKRFCSECGRSLNLDSKFCPECGKKVE